MTGFGGRETANEQGEVRGDNGHDGRDCTGVAEAKVGQQKQGSLGVGLEPGWVGPEPCQWMGGLQGAEAGARAWGLRAQPQWVRREEWALAEAWKAASAEGSGDWYHSRHDRQWRCRHHHHP